MTDEKQQFIDRLKQTDWDDFPDSKPNQSCIDAAFESLPLFRAAGLEPRRIVHLYAGEYAAINICFRKNIKYADIEFYNDGDVLVSAGNVFRLVDVPAAVQHIKNYLESAETT